MPRALIHVLLALLVLPAVAAGDGPVFELRDFPESAGPLPDPSVFPVQLVHDDNSAEGAFGLTGASARQFLWLNRFDNPGPFTLEEIWVLFPSGMDVPLGGDVQLAVYLDPDGDPTTGADLLTTYDALPIQATDGATFSVYPLDPPLNVLDSGDVLVGVVNRYFMTGGDPPPTLPAAVDTTVSQNRSYFALWTLDPPDPPDLASADLIDLLDGAAAGNFMIRGFGRPFGVPFIPTLDRVGMALLAALLSLAGIVVVGRRRATAPAGSGRRRATRTPRRSA